MAVTINFLAICLLLLLANVNRIQCESIPFEMNYQIVWAEGDRCFKDQSTPDDPVQHIITGESPSNCTTWKFTGAIEIKDRKGIEQKTHHFLGQIKNSENGHCLTYHPYNQTFPRSWVDDRLPINPDEYEVHGDLRSSNCEDKTYPDTYRQFVVLLPPKIPELNDRYQLYPAGGPTVFGCLSARTGAEIFRSMPTIFFGSDKDSRLEAGCGRTAWRVRKDNDFVAFQGDLKLGLS